jgi:hypothetical protein
VTQGHGGQREAVVLERNRNVCCVSKEKCA